MKRILTSILLLLVLTLSVHPIFTLHFCGDKLHSFSLNSTTEANACCSTSFTNEINNFKELSTSLITPSESCCSFQKVEVVTSNFTLEHTHTAIQKIFSLTYIPASAILNYLINLFTPDAVTIGKDHFFPSGLYSTTLKFLSYICVYRL